MEPNIPSTLTDPVKTKAYEDRVVRMSVELIDLLQKHMDEITKEFGVNLSLNAGVVATIYLDKAIDSVLARIGPTGGLFAMLGQQMARHLAPRMVEEADKRIKDDDTKPTQSAGVA